MWISINQPVEWDGNGTYIKLFSWLIYYKQLIYIIHFRTIWLSSRHILAYNISVSLHLVTNECHYVCQFVSLKNPSFWQLLWSRFDELLVFISSIPNVSNSQLFVNKFKTLNHFNRFFQMIFVCIPTPTRIHGTGIFTYIYHKNQPNVGKYAIHGFYGK